MRELLHEYLNSNNIWYEDVPRSDWIKVKCMNPEHKDRNPSAGINVETGIHHCFSCGYNIMVLNPGNTDADKLWSAKYQNLKKSTSEVNDMYEALEAASDRKGQIVLPPVEHYLNEDWRGVPGHILSDLKAYYCSTGRYSGRYVFPVYQDGCLYGFDARIVDATAKMVGAKWIRPRGMQVLSVAYPLEYLVAHKYNVSHLLITEGVMDALSYIAMGVPAIASFGLTEPNESRIARLLSAGVQQITLAFDNDKAGQDGTLRVYPSYAEWFDIVSHPLVRKIQQSGEKDANDYLTKVYLSNAMV